MRKKTISVLAGLLILLCLALPTFAEGGNGDGSGGGSGNSLTVASSSISDGSSDVALDVEITLTFSKNVVNMSVKDINMGCFTLTDANGTVPINVLMGDDQVDPTIKRIIQIDPVDSLSPGTKYMLTISKALTSKSGDSLQSDISLSFTTTGGTAYPTPSVTPSPVLSIASPASSSETAAALASSIAPSPQISAEAAPQSTISAAPSTIAGDESSDASAETSASAKPQSVQITRYIAAALVLAAVVIYPVIKRKRKR